MSEQPDHQPDLDLYHRAVARFTALVDGVGDDRWQSDTPDEGWTVADLVAHVVDRDRMLAATVGGAAPSELDGVRDAADLPGAWRERVQWWTLRLADPATAAASWETPFGTQTFAQAAVAFTVGELTIHAWDLARALGADETLDPEAVRVTFEQLQSAESTVRRPGVMAAAVDVPDDADEQTRLLAFTGRRP